MKDAASQSIDHFEGDRQRRGLAFDAEPSPAEQRRIPLRIGDGCERVDRSGRRAVPAEGRQHFGGEDATRVENGSAFDRQRFEGSSYVGNGRIWYGEEDVGRSLWQLNYAGDVPHRIIGED